ncbi:MAG TPA: AbrB/MazE/SpoVT family DNA-binding domain-containing protein [Candidatus Lokiarchaeia archaeon]|nr:AbrB/MazE/SpoVT family DNA-binding domain-containing protein [Candidatus Lokiarchaeia archaeon]
MGTNTEVKRVDSQGRIVLPLDWRETNLEDGNEVIIIKEKGCLKIVPKKKVDLTQYFDAIEFDEDITESLENWDETEKRLARKEIQEQEEQ